MWIVNSGADKIHGIHINTGNRKTDANSVKAVIETNLQSPSRVLLSIATGIGITAITIIIAIVVDPNFVFQDAEGAQ